MRGSRQELSVSITCSSSTLKDLNKTLEAINEQLQAEVSEHEKTEKELLDSKEAAEQQSGLRQRFWPTCPMN